jgi:hypothetical protein
MRSRTIAHGTQQELAPLRDDETWVRVWTELADDAWQTIAAWFVDRPALRLSVERGADLEMLRWFPALRRLGANSLRLRSLDGLRHVSGTLERLSVGDTISRASLRPVGTLRTLQTLDVNGTWADIDTIGRLTGLRELGIGSIDLGLLQPLRHLERFTSGLGTIRSLELLPEIGRLELIELYRLRGPHDLTPLARVPQLRWLILESTSSVTSLPSFGRSQELRWVALDSMKGIRDLQAVADAPALEVLLLIAMPQLGPENLRPFVGHPTLRAGIWGFGSKRKNAEAQTVLPLPPSGTDPLPWNQPGWTGIRHWNRHDD